MDIATRRKIDQKKRIAMGDFPFLSFPSPEMELFSPDEQNSKETYQAKIQNLPLYQATKMNPNRTFIPRVKDCQALWDEYLMPTHICNHSENVAVFMLALADMASKSGYNVNFDAVCAAGLLHDLAKSYCIENGGNHAQLGAAWVMRELRNASIAQAVLFHVHWPWDDQLGKCIQNDTFFTAFSLIYADKRVKHDKFVTVDERYEDLQVRYGFNEIARERIELSRLQGKLIEKLFSERFGVDLNEYSPDYRRLVF